MVRKDLKEAIKLDIRILLLGDSSAGKSTLLGVLMSGGKELDNGKGHASGRIMTNKSDVLKKKTVGIRYHFLGFDSQG
jgi:GTPase